MVCLFIVQCTALQCNACHLASRPGSSGGYFRPVPRSDSSRQSPAPDSLLAMRSADRQGPSSSEGSITTIDGPTDSDGTRGCAVLRDWHECANRDLAHLGSEVFPRCGMACKLDLQAVYLQMQRCAAFRSQRCLPKFARTLVHLRRKALHSASRVRAHWSRVECSHCVRRRVGTRWV